MEIDISKLDAAIVDCLTQQDIAGGRYCVVVWGPPGSRTAAVASNVHSQRTIEEMLTGALAVVSQTPPDELVFQEPKGSA